VVGDALPEVIETDRLVLRPYTLGDVDDVIAYARDPEWARFLRTIPQPYEREDAERFIATQLLLDRVTHPAWAITLEYVVIGGINLRFAFEHRPAEIGYSVARVHWKKGICSEAARAVIDAAFSTHQDLNRVHARADAAPSMKPGIRSCVRNGVGDRDRPASGGLPTGSQSLRGQGFSRPRTRSSPRC
jgi:RimJ/RimL family protein N-acetyltransferase